MSRSDICQSQLFRSLYIRDCNIFLIFVMCIFSLQIFSFVFRVQYVIDWLLVL